MSCPVKLLVVVHVCGSEIFSAGVVLVWKLVGAGSMSRVGRAFFRAHGAYRIHCGVHPGDSLWYALRGFTVVCIEGIHCGVH